MLSAALFLTLSMVVGQADGEATFNPWMNFSVGGKWTTTVDGVKSEISYKRTLNCKIVQADHQAAIREPQARRLLRKTSRRRQGGQEKSRSSPTHNPAIRITATAHKIPHGVVCL